MGIVWAATMNRAIGIDIDSPEFLQTCKRHGLNAESIRLHARRIRRSLANKEQPYLTIVDTCRRDNGGILTLPQFKRDNVNRDGFISFIPAAGASSRYLKNFADFVIAAESADLIQAESQLAIMREKISERRFLPLLLQQLLQREVPLTAQTCQDLFQILTQPKAFFPCTVDGESFASMKILEDQKWEVFVGTVFVCGTQSRSTFEKFMTTHHSQREIVLCEQGVAQSTIRFNEHGEPVLESDGSLSLVPAGHGTLAGLIPGLKAHFPTAHSVLIRNVDNLIGCHEATHRHIVDLMVMHENILHAVRQIRKDLSANKIDTAETVAMRLIGDLALASTAPEKKGAARASALWQVQAILFHCDHKLAVELFGNLDEVTLLKNLYARPVNTMGQVPNTQHDIGGTPVFVKMGEATYKICIEAPHASPDDIKAFLANNSLATHFNPVFVLAEIDYPEDHYAHAERAAWLLAKKTYLGQTVYYHESVLYELMGNNALANVVFVEIPRSLFNPHKFIEDCRPLTTSEWFS